MMKLPVAILLVICALLLQVCIVEPFSMLLHDQRAAGAPDLFGSLTTQLLQGANTRQLKDDEQNITLSDDELMRCMVPTIPIDPISVAPIIYMFTAPSGQTSGEPLSAQAELNLAEQRVDCSARFEFDSLDEGGVANDYVDGVQQISPARSCESACGTIEDALKCWNPNGPTLIVTHGFMASATVADTWLLRLKNIVLSAPAPVSVSKSDGTMRHERPTVFVVDWSRGSQPLLGFADYGRAVASTHLVAQMLAHFFTKLLALHEPHGLIGDPALMHCVGHSLGAHVCGMLGKQMRHNLAQKIKQQRQQQQQPLNINRHGDVDDQQNDELDNIERHVFPKLGRITALDPAGPCYSTLMTTPLRKLIRPDNRVQAPNDDLERRRLTRWDAHVVVALHTDASVFGLNENVADMDVYVNGGSSQPGCRSIGDKVRQALTLQVRAFMENQFSVECSHTYAHSLVSTWLGGTQCQQVAYKCSSWRAFKTGQCGHCDHTNRQCVLAMIDAQSFVKLSDTSAELPLSGYSGVSDLVPAPDAPPLVSVRQFVSSVRAPADKFVQCALNQTYELVSATHAGIQSANNPNNIANSEIDIDDIDNLQDDQDDDDDYLLDRGNPLAMRVNETNLHREQRYYMRTDDSSATCVFMYQVIVELNQRFEQLDYLRSKQQQQRSAAPLPPPPLSGQMDDQSGTWMNWMLQVPQQLVESTLLLDEQSTARSSQVLVTLFHAQRMLRNSMRVSHRVTPKQQQQQTRDQSYFYRYDDPAGTLHVPTYVSLDSVILARDPTLDAMSALLTLPLVEKEELRNNNDTVEQKRPLKQANTIDRVIVTAPDVSLLNAITRITINFMSSSDYSTRVKYSTRLCRNRLDLGAQPQPETQLELSTHYC
ncbi:Lipase member I [Fragariocoptes setiger]|uniref:Lipase member I n=1 Tax=Fragariocoptes setiger TaxID=1670756 RepID=A0ABQ7S962_9ACAR|nr:Lipase member I [Fragariocoptes setiger]